MFKHISFEIFSRFKGSLILRGSDSYFYLLSLSSRFDVDSEFVCKGVRYRVKDKFEIDTSSFDFVINFNANFREIIFNNYFMRYLNNALFYLHRLDSLV